MKDPDAIVERLKVKLVRISTTECWEWLGGCNTSGYGMLSVDGRKALVHRISYALFRGPVPKKAMVLHTCDNPKCANPNHLFLGDQTDNMQDMVRKGRGIHTGNTKITPEILVDIRADIADGMSTPDLSLKYKLSQPYIREIKAGSRRFSRI